MQFCTVYFSFAQAGHRGKCPSPLHIFALLALVELFDVKYHRDLEMWVRDHSRSLKMVRFDRTISDFLLVCHRNYKGKGKDKGKGLDTCYSATYMS